MAGSPQALMLLVAFASGLIRALGPAGVSLGLTVGLTFLVGIGVHHHGGSALEWAALYIAGGLWTILLTLAFWHVRPYRRLEQEVAGIWEETATLVATARAFVGPRPSVVRRRRQERLIAKRHQALREAVALSRNPPETADSPTFVGRVATRVASGRACRRLPA